MTTTPASRVPQTTSRYIELMDMRVARTERLCTAEPYRQAVRAALLRAEEEVHAGEGWDSAPRVFALNRHVETDQVSYMVVDAWSRGLASLSMSTADVLLAVATTAEVTRRVMDAALSTSGTDLTQDLPPSWAFHGVGLMTKAYTVFDTGITAGQEAHDVYAAEHHVSTHPASVEVRQVHFYDRCGTWWEVTRHRRSPAANVPRYCIALPPGQVDVSGDVPNALSRVCDAIAGNSVPILPQTDDGPRQ